MTNDELLKVVQGETEGKTIMVRALFITGVSHITPSDIQWHEKSADKSWLFGSCEYKVKPMSIKDYIEARLDEPWNDTEFARGAIEMLDNILNFIKENK